MDHLVYIVCCADGSFYTGYTTDTERRIKEHNGEGDSKSEQSAGARYTRGRRPVKLFYKESFATRSEAMKRECAIKKMTKAEKVEMIKNYKHSLNK